MYSFLKEILGVEGAQTITRALNKSENLKELILPRTIYSWLSIIDRFDGPIPGVANSKLSLVKSNGMFSGSLAINDTEYYFDKSDPIRVAASITILTNPDKRPIKRVRDVSIAKLGKSIDLLTKSNFEKKVLDPSLGYTFSHHHRDTGDGNMMTHVYAHDNMGKEVGTVGFAHQGSNLLPVVVYVQPEHRRQGIASAMYSHAENLTGKKIIPSKAQTEAGEALWAGSGGKQFGKDEIGQGRPHSPVPPQGPEPQEQTQKQQSKAKPPKGFRISKSMADTVCSMCGLKQIENDVFVGCNCFQALSNNVKLYKHETGYIINFKGLDGETVSTIMEMLKG